MSALDLKDLREFLKKNSLGISDNTQTRWHRSPIHKALQIFLEEQFILNEHDIRDKIFDEHFLVSETIWFAKIHDIVSKSLFENYPSLRRPPKNTRLGPTNQKPKKICSVAEGMNLTSQAESRFNSLTLLNLDEAEKVSLGSLLRSKRMFCEELGKLISALFHKSKQDAIANFTKKNEFVELCLIVNQTSRRGTLRRRTQEFRSEIVSFVSQLAEKLGTNHRELAKIFRWG